VRAPVSNFALMRSTPSSGKPIHSRQPTCVFFCFLVFKFKSSRLIDQSISQSAVIRERPCAGHHVKRLHVYKDITQLEHFLGQQAYEFIRYPATLHQSAKVFGRYTITTIRLSAEWSFVEIDKFFGDFIRLGILDLHMRMIYKNLSITRKNYL